MPTRVRWENERLYAANSARHIDNLRFVFLRLATARHPTILRTLSEIYQEAVFARRDDAARRELYGRPIKGLVGSTKALRSTDVRAVIRDFVPLLESLNLNCWWIRNLATERVVQWELEVHRPAAARGPVWLGWSQPGPLGLGVEKGTPLALSTKVSDTRTPSPTFAPIAAWHPGELTLNAWMRTVVDAHIDHQKAWASEREWQALPAGYQPDESRAWTISPSLNRRMGWLVRRVVDGHSLREIAKGHGRNAARDVLRATRHLSALLGIGWRPGKGGRPRKTPDKSR